MAKLKKSETVKIKMKTSMAGGNFSYMPGEEIEVTAEVAKAWVEADIAEMVEGEK